MKPSEQLRKAIADQDRINKWTDPFIYAIAIFVIIWELSKLIH